MLEGYINAFHHDSPHAGEFSFNGHFIAVTREAADIWAREECAVERHTRRIGIWRVKSKG